MKRIAEGRYDNENDLARQTSKEVRFSMQPPVGGPIPTLTANV